MIISKARNAWQMMPCGSFTMLDALRSRVQGQGQCGMGLWRGPGGYRSVEGTVRAVVTIITTSKWFSEMLFELFAGNYFYFQK